MTYTRLELGSKTKLELRPIAKELGITFDNGTSGPDLIERILAKQAPAPNPQDARQPVGDQGPDADEDDDGEGEDSGEITVQCGASSMPIAGAGRTVDQIRGQLRDALNIGQGFEPRVNGEKITGGHVLRAGDSLEFVKPSGDKA